MSSDEKKEIVQKATHRAKAAVEDAQDHVKEYMNELRSIESQLQAARQQQVTPDRSQIESLERRLKEIQEDMSRSVEAASQEVSQATSEAKAKIGHAGGPADTAKQGRARSATSSEIERQDTGAHDVIAPTSLTDKYSATSPRPSPGPNNGSAVPRKAAEAKGVTDDEGRDSTPTSATARASQGIFGGFHFHSGGGDREVESSSDDDDDDSGPTADDVTASVDQAGESVNLASASNQAAAQDAAEDVRGRFEKQSLGK